MLDCRMRQGILGSVFMKVVDDSFMRGMISADNHSIQTRGVIQDMH